MNDADIEMADLKREARRSEANVRRLMVRAKGIPILSLAKFFLEYGQKYPTAEIRNEAQFVEILTEYWEQFAPRSK